MRGGETRSDTPDRRGVLVNYYMLETTLCTADGVEDEINDEVKAFMKAGQLTPIDTYSLVHGQSCKIFGETLNV